MADAAEEAKALFFAALDDLDAGENVMAEERLRAALALAPGRASALTNLAVALLRQAKYEEALDAGRQAVAADADDPEGWVLVGTALGRLHRIEESVAAFDKATALDPGNVEAWQARADIGMEAKRYGLALESLERVQALHPSANTLAALIHARQHLAMWEGIEDLWATMLSDDNLASDEPPVPFQLLSMPSTPAQQLAAAQRYSAHNYPAIEPPLWAGEVYRHARFRVAFISPDFREHATALLTAGMFECFNRRLVELIAISTGPNDKSYMRRRLEQVFERFIDAQGQSDEQVARLLRAMEVDVVVDLAGHTALARTGIVARRPAPVQVSYLGYPGTVGAPYYDYILADATVVPEAERQFYSEAVVTLPNSYQANDSSRHLPRLIGKRTDHGLPEDGIVFCAFSNPYKITPEVFDVWMRLLEQVDGSVLWLLENDPVTSRNLRREAVARGVPAERLVFAPRTGLEDHVDRHRHADIFLDTLIYNGHTTVSDALWAGLPVISRPGNTFAGRVGASLLKAANLPEMVTESLAEYEALALEMARDPARLSAAKRKVISNRAICPLFETERFARQFQAGLIMMVGRARLGQKPEAFAVEPLEVWMR